MSHIVLVAGGRRSHAVWRAPLELLGRVHTVRVVVPSQDEAGAWGVLPVRVVSPPAGARRMLDRLMRPSFAVQAARDPLLASELSTADLVLVDEETEGASTLGRDALGGAAGQRALASLLVDQMIASGGTPFAPADVLEVERRALDAGVPR